MSMSARTKRLSERADRLQADRDRFGSWEVPASYVLHAHCLAALSGLHDALASLRKIVRKKKIAQINRRRRMNGRRTH